MTAPTSDLRDVQPRVLSGRYWHQGPTISPFEVRRRVGRVRTNDLRVLDLTAADVQAHLGIKPEELLGDDY